MVQFERKLMKEQQDGGQTFGRLSLCTAATGETRDPKTQSPWETDCAYEVRPTQYGTSSTGPPAHVVNICGVRLGMWRQRTYTLQEFFSRQKIIHIIPRNTLYTVFAEINAHPEISAHQKQWFFTGGSTQNRRVLVGDFSKGGSTQNRRVLLGNFSKGGVHKTDGFWWVLEFVFCCFWKLSARGVYSVLHPV